MAAGRLVYFLAGAALGALGTAAVKDGKNSEVLKSVVVGGHELADKVLGSVETLKEDVEDYLAEARYMREERMRQAAQEQATDAASPTEEASAVFKVSTAAGNSTEEAPVVESEEAPQAEKKERESLA